MPLKKGSSRKTIGRNVGEMVRSWEYSGKIGASRPRSKKKAVKQAVAISLKKAGKSKYQRPKKSATSRAKELIRLAHPAPAQYSM